MCKRLRSLIPGEYRKNFLKISVNNLIQGESRKKIIKMHNFSCILEEF